jgi:hypothetical protein
VLAGVLEGEAEFLKGGIDDQLLDKFVADAGEEDVEGFAGLTNFGAELLEGRFPGAGRGVLSIGAEGGGNEGLEVSKGLEFFGTVVVGESDLVEYCGISAASIYWLKGAQRIVSSAIASLVCSTVAAIWGSWLPL